LALAGKYTPRNSAVPVKPVDLRKFLRDNPLAFGVAVIVTHFNILKNRSIIIKNRCRFKQQH